MIYSEGGEYITPLFEIRLDKTIQKVLILAGDVTWTNWEGRDQHFIDDDILTFTHTANNTMPGASVTFDMGKPAKLSRFILHQRQDRFEEYPYRVGNFHIFEIYSSNDYSDNPSGDWSTWIHQSTYTLIKPSRAAYGTMTEEDRAAARDGHDFSFPLNMPPVRYIRLKVIEAWALSSSHVYCGEFTTYGLYVE
jgi:hypothetical protein